MSLRWRVLLFSAGGILVLLGLFSYFGLAAVRQSSQQTLNERLRLTEQVARSIDVTLRESFREVGIISQGVFDKAGEAGPALAAFVDDVKSHLPFNIAYIIVADRQGTARMVDTQTARSSVPDSVRDGYIAQVFSTGQPAVTNSFLDAYTREYVVYLVVPVLDPAGRPVEVICLATEVSSGSIDRLVDLSQLKQGGYTEIVDGNGVVIATTWPQSLLQTGDHGGVFAGLIKAGKTSVSTCHSCHSPSADGQPSQDIITFAPLSNAPWGVVVRQPQAEALATADSLRQRLVIFGLISFFVLMPIIWFASRKLTDPINRITAASQKIASGSLNEPVARIGTDEISVLSQNFDIMRIKLKDSIESLNERTRELERLSAEKAKLYEDLLEKEKMLTQLLQHSVSAAEDERKRIARELHDETSQALTTLAIGLETIAKSPPGSAERLKQAVKKNQDLTIKILDDIHRLILDLRPSVLDDMGLIPALEWYAANRLGTDGVRVHLETSGTERRLPAHIEVSLFRIAQEALSNIAQHARAETAPAAPPAADEEITTTPQSGPERVAPPPPPAVAPPKDAQPKDQPPQDQKPPGR